jgi:mono/diheme cytochrome c family protein
MIRQKRLKRALLCAVAAALTSSLAIAAETQSGSDDDEHPAFPPGEGRELTLKVCSQCHTPEVAADQQLDPAGWKDLVEEMASRGAVATDAELDQIVKYLAKVFPASK